MNSVNAPASSLPPSSFSVCNTMDMFNIAEHIPKVTVFGMGRIGICLSLLLEEHCGMEVCGVDINPAAVDAINMKTLNTQEPGVVSKLAVSKKLRATSSFDEGFNFSNILLIMIDTPTSENGYDHSKLTGLLQHISSRNPNGKHIVVLSTVLPGYYQRTAKPLLQKFDCSYTYCPAFVAQGEIMRGYQGGAFGMVILGAGVGIVNSTKSIGDCMECIFRTLARNNTCRVCRMSPESAEIAKLASNCFRTIKISFANMIGDLADRMEGAEKHEICRALQQDDSIGKVCMMPGYGYGGPCYPRDNVALGLVMESNGVQHYLGSTADAFNKFHAKVMAENLASQKSSSYVFEDVSYKDRCPLPWIENSQKLQVAKLLAEMGKCVIIRDRKAVLELVQQEYGGIFTYEECPGFA